ncbi:MAG: TonB-dependent receptor [Gammaproteobacteria bacterium]
MFNRESTVLAAFVLIQTLVLPARAADEARRELAPIVVTATRTAVASDHTLAPVTVIERAEIERSMAVSVAELLRFHGGIEVASNGGPGQVTSVFIRGAESDQTLVLIDGVRINSGTSGIAPIENISPNIVERIEIVKGPRAALYGSEAVGGVINIITRKDNSGLRASASTGAGHYGTRTAAGELAIAGAAGGGGVNLSWLDTDGFPTFTASDNDAGYDNLTIDSWGQTEIHGAKVGAHFWRAHGTTEYSDFFLLPVKQHYTNSIGQLNFELEPAANWNTRLSLSRVFDKIDQGSGAFDPQDYTRTDRYELDWQNNITLRPWLELVAGLHGSREQTSGIIFGTPLEKQPGSGDIHQDVDAVYLETIGQFGRQRVVAAVRRSDYDVFGTEDSWNLDYGLDIGRGLRFTAGAGRAFRAPTSLDLYGFGGNPDLKPEVSHAWDFNFIQRIGEHQTLSIGGFSNRIKNLIEFVFTDPANFVGENRNVEKARINGAELAYRFQGEDWHLRWAATLQDPKNLTDDEKLLRRADRLFTLALVRQFGRHEAGIDLLASDDREDFGGARLAGYMLINLNARIQLSRHLTLRTKVENLLDKDYELAAGYNTAGRGAYATLNYDY